jgi:hypothetical protein
MSVAGSALGLRARKSSRRQALVERTYLTPSANMTAIRYLVRVTAWRWGIDPEGLELVTSELATNAVQHGWSPFAVSLILDGDTVRVEVADKNPAVPKIVDTTLLARGGRGLVIIEQAASRWGCRPLDGGGKTVWAELDVETIR